jgi:hypothetical protein
MNNRGCLSRQPKQDSEMRAPISRGQFWIGGLLAVFGICLVVTWCWFASIHLAGGARAPDLVHGGWHTGDCYSGLWLLDVLFGIPYAVVNSIGLWHSGPSWFADRPLLSSICYFVWPLLVILLLGIGCVAFFAIMWSRRRRFFRVLAILVPIVLLAGVLAIHGQLGLSQYSYWKYSFNNY